MAFLSCKTVLAVETAFAHVLHPHNVAQGEQLLKDLRGRQDYELALATFVSRSQDINQRLLAMLQLEKLHTIKQQQSAWCLSTVYYRDNERVARIIGRLMSRPQNIEWSGLLLGLDFQQVGFIEVIRWVEIAFRLLTLKQIEREVVELYSKQLWKGLSQAGCFAADNQQLLLMVTTCSVLLLQLELEAGKQKEDIVQCWERVPRQEPQSSSLFFLRQTANKLLFDYQLTYRQNQMHDLIRGLLHCLQINDSLQLPYLCLTLQLIQTHLTPLQPYSHQIAAAIHDYSHQINQLQLQDPTYHREQGELTEGQWELRSHKAMHTLVGDLLESYEGWGSGCDEGDLQLGLLAILNYYGHPDLPSIAPLLPKLVDLAASRLAHLLSAHQLTPTNTDALSEAITCLEFLGSFRTQIAMGMIGYVGRLVGQVASVCSCLATAAYGCLELLSERLACLPLGELSDFLLEHGDSLNADEWGHCLSSYHCFLALVNDLHARYHYFSLATPSDPLLHTALAAHATLARLLPQTPIPSLDFTLIYALIDLSAALVVNPHLPHPQNLHSQIGVGQLVEAIDRHNLLSCSAGKVVAFHRLAQGTLLGRLQEESTRWEMDQQDYAYRIQLYVSELHLAQPLEEPQQLESYRRSLTHSIAKLVNGLPAGGRQSLVELGLGAWGEGCGGWGEGGSGEG